MSGIKRIRLNTVDMVGVGNTNIEKDIVLMYNDGATDQNLLSNCFDPSITDKTNLGIISAFKYDKEVRDLEIVERKTDITRVDNTFITVQNNFNEIKDILEDLLCDVRIDQILSIFGNNDPTISPPGDQTSDEKDTISLQIVASDPDTNDTLTYSASNLPDGLSINETTGLISGTLSYSSAGQNTVTVSVSDGSSSVSIVFTWTVSNVNRWPVITTPGNQTSDENDTISLQIVASDPDTNDTLTYSSSTLPDGLSINSNTGLISGTLSSIGTTSTTVYVSDGSLTASSSFDWYVLLDVSWDDNNTVTIGDETVNSINYVDNFIDTQISNNNNIYVCDGALGNALFTTTDEFDVKFHIKKLTGAVDLYIGIISDDFITTHINDVKPFYIAYNAYLLNVSDGEFVKPNSNNDGVTIMTTTASSSPKDGDIINITLVEGDLIFTLNDDGDKSYIWSSSDINSTKTYRLIACYNGGNRGNNSNNKLYTSLGVNDVSNFNMGGNGTVNISES